MKFSSSWVFFILFLLSAAVFAQEIASVEFQQDSEYTFKEDLLRFNVQSKKGAQYNERIVNEDVKRLFAMGVFRFVDSKTEMTPEGKVAITYYIVPKPVVSEIFYEGNEKYSTKKISELVKITVGTPLNDALLKQSRTEIEEFYRSEGYNDAHISVTINDNPMNAAEITLTFKIVENLRVRVNDVNFEGNTVYKASELRSGIATRYSFLSKSWLSWLPIQTGGLLDQEDLDRDKVRLRELYWRKGYLDFRILETKIETLPDDPEMANVTFVVEEGEPYTIGTVRINGAERFSEDELMALLSLKPGMVYNVQLEENDMTELEQKYTPLGYADFQKEAIRRPDYTTHTVDIDYNIFEGDLYRINEIYISGNKVTKDYVLRRELPIIPMDPADKAMLPYIKSRFEQMGYFEEDGVEVTMINSSEPGMKDIDIKLHERNFIEFKLGAGLSDTDGFAGMFQISHTNLDIFDPMNYFSGGGQRLSIDALIGIENMNIETTFTEPWLFGIPLRLDISGYWREVMYDYWNEQRIGFSIELTKRILDEFTTINAGYKFEQVAVLEMDRHRSEKFQSEKGRDFVGQIYGTLRRDTRDSIMNPKSGYDISLYGAFASHAFGGSNNYYKAELKGINYYSFFNDWFTLSTGFKIGSIGMLGSHHDEMVPIYDRYFLGGGDSVRGFPYRSIGPTDSDDKNYGGQFMYLFTAELSHPIYKDFLRGAAFIDIGDVTRASFGPINSPNIGAGYGLRIMIPGVKIPIRLDLGYPVLVNQEGIKRRVYFHMSMGFVF